MNTKIYNCGCPECTGEEYDPCELASGNLPNGNDLGMLIVERDTALCQRDSWNSAMLYNDDALLARLKYYDEDNARAVAITEKINAMVLRHGAFTLTPYC